LTPRIASRVPRRGGTSFQRAKRSHGEVSLGEKAFWDYVDVGPTGDGGHVLEMLPADERQLLEEQRVLSKASSGGGFLVPTDVGEMITAAARAASAVAQVAQEVITATGDTLGMAIAGTHGTAAWTAESGSYTASDETITQQNLSAYKSTSKIIVSEELRTDSFVELDAYLAQELGSRIGALQENAFFVGDGSGKPLGIAHASSGYTAVTAATGSTTRYTLTDLKSVYKALPAGYRPNASWIMHADDFAELAALTDSAGGLVLPSLQFEPSSLFGRPAYISGDMPTPAANARSLAFGDWSRAYGIRHVSAIGLQRQDELHSDSGQVGYKVFARVDGRPLLTDAARILAHSAT
jgi:HK97 family phage major capsid protein